MTESSHWMKIGAAFVAGLVLALGGSLIYVRVTDQERPPVIVQAPHRTPALVMANPVVTHPEVTNPAPPITEPEVTQPDVNQPEAIQPGTIQRQVKHTRPVKLPQLKQPKPVFHKADVLMAKQRPSRDVAPPPIIGHPVAPAQPVAVAAASPEPLNQEVPPPPDTSPAEPAYQPHVVTLPAGTNLSIRLGERLSTAANYSGDTFRGTLEAPIITDGFVIADRGSKVLGRIVVSQKAGRVQGVSDLSLALTEINTTDGQRVSVSTNTVEKRGLTSTGQDAAEIAGGAALGAIIGAIAGGGKGAAIGAGAGGAAGTGAVLMTRGKAATFESESVVGFHLASPLTITEKLNH